MTDNLLCSSAEAACTTEGPGERTGDHIDLVGIDVLCLCYASTCPSEHTKGPGLVDYKTEFVLEFQFDLERVSAQFQKSRYMAHQFRQIRHISDVFKEAFRDDEPPRQRFSRLVLCDFC